MKKDSSLPPKKKRGWKVILVILLAVSFDMIKLHREERLQTKVDIEKEDAQ